MAGLLLDEESEWTSDDRIATLCKKSQDMEDFQVDMEILSSRAQAEIKGGPRLVFVGSGWTWS